MTAQRESALTSPDPYLLTELRSPQLAHDVLVREVPVGVEKVPLNHVVVDLILPGD